MGTKGCTLTYEELELKKMYLISMLQLHVTKERWSKIILSSIERLASSNSKFNFTTFGFLS